MVVPVFGVRDQHPSFLLFPPKSLETWPRRCSLHLPMSKTLTRSLHTLQLCERQVVQKCASQHTTRYLRDDLQPKRLCLSPQTRPFSSTQQWRASQMGRAIKPSGRKQVNPAMAVQMQQQKQKAFRDGQIPDDIGLLPDTFVMPRGKKRPSWFSNFWGRWRMETKRLRTRITETGR